MRLPIKFPVVPAVTVTLPVPASVLSLYDTVKPVKSVTSTLFPDFMDTGRGSAGVPVYSNTF